MQTSEKRRRFSCLSDIGTARKNNEDAAYAASSQFGALLIVADGMGGHRKGEMASKIVLDELSQDFASARHAFSPDRAMKFLKKGLKKANKRIYKLSLSGNDYKEMGTTAVCAFITPEKALVCNIGDSRCYAYSKRNGLMRITTDQTYVELLFETGKITKSEMRTHPQRNLLINAIGINPDLNEIQERVVEKEDYDILLLCSDGLYNAVSEDRIAEILASMEEAPILARKLIDEALLNRGTDNIAVSLWENF